MTNEDRPKINGNFFGMKERKAVRENPLNFVVSQGSTAEISLKAKVQIDFFLAAVRFTLGLPLQGMSKERWSKKLRLLRL